MAPARSGGGLSTVQIVIGVFLAVASVASTTLFLADRSEMGKYSKEVKVYEERTGENSRDIESLKIQYAGDVREIKTTLAQLKELLVWHMDGRNP